MKSFILSFISVFSFASFANEVSDISAQQLLDAKTSDWVILDVRSTKEYNQGHVPGAINIAHSEIEKHIQKLSKYKDKPVVVYCKSGYRAGKATDILLEHDFKQVKHLDGDMQGWEARGLEIEK